MKSKFGWIHSAATLARPFTAAPQAAEQDTIIMATTVVTPAIPTPVSPTPTGNSFLKSIEKVGHKILAWLGSPQNQKVVIALEEAGAVAAEISAPALTQQIQTGLLMAETLTKHIFTAQALGASAVNQDPSATNLQKAAAVIASAGPELIKTAKDAGLHVDVAAANNAMVAYWNAIGAGVQLIDSIKSAPAAQ